METCQQYLERTNGDHQANAHPFYCIEPRPSNFQLWYGQENNGGGGKDIHNIHANTHPCSCLLEQDK